MRDRVATLIRLYSEAKLVARNRNYDEMIAHVDNLPYSELLIKHLHFRPEQGRILRLEI